MNVFTYMYFSKSEAKEVKRTVKLTKMLNDSTKVLHDRLYDAEYFSLEHNGNAQNYLEEYEVTKLIPQVKDALLEYNTGKDGNKYTDQVPFGDKKFIINKMKVLNHRWIIADFSNGEYWGEVLLKYFVNEDKSISFETIQSFIYPKQ